MQIHCQCTSKVHLQIRQKIKSGDHDPTNVEGSNLVGIGNICGDVCVWLANQNTYNINQWNKLLISNLEYMLTTLMPKG